MPYGIVTAVVFCNIHNIPDFKRLETVCFISTNFCASFQSNKNHSLINSIQTALNEILVACDHILSAVSTCNFSSSVNCSKKGYKILFMPLHGILLSLNALDYANFYQQ
jgi:hypothetical protein